MANLDLWNKYREVPANALKDFDNGNFKGTDINTMWRMKCLTEEYGICGIGWYYDIIRTWNENIPFEQGGEILTFAEIKLYLKVNGEWSKGITGVGGNKMLSYVKSKDYFKASDEAIKMAVTDAIGNACRNLGFGADVYWENDKTKYTENSTPQTNEKVTPKSNTQNNPQTTKKAQYSGCYCERCNEMITDKVAKYSKEKFGEMLCFNCQKHPEPEQVDISDDDLPWN